MFLAILVKVIRLLCGDELLKCKKNPIVCRISSVKCTCYAWLLSFVLVDYSNTLICSKILPKSCCIMAGCQT